MEHTFLNRPEFSGLKACWGNFSEPQQRLAASLLEAGQRQLFTDWDPPSINDEAKTAFLALLAKIDRAYPGGLTGYIKNSRKLLSAAKAGLNPFQGLLPEQPEKIDLTKFSSDFEKYEACGVRQFEKCGIVLVAGGLGERLGYHGLKLDIAVEALQSTPYIRHYAESILAMQARMQRPRPVPFIIMVSQDTGPGTHQTLEADNYFGLEKSQVHILQQELVPAIADNEGTLALEEKYKLILKPHGHGDIHMLLYTSGIAAQLQREGIEYLMFIQDTNAQVFNTLPAALGVSFEKGYDFNSLAIDRVPGEAIGALVKLTGRGRTQTLNVEYNQLDPLLRATVSPEGDTASEQGVSMFPGNCNTLLIRLAAYVKILEASQGIVAEFVNPKYTDTSRSVFKKPTRLETMMQDLPKLFGASEKAGVTVFSRMWSFSPNKNKTIDAAANAAAGRPADSAVTAENDFYAAGRARLVSAGMKVVEAPKKTMLDIPFTPGPKVILRPSFAMSLAEGRQKISGGSIDEEATLILDGEDITLKEVELSGSSALVIKACKGAKVTIKGPFRNKGFKRVELNAEERSTASGVPEYLKIRGYAFENQGAAVYEFDVPGEYTVEA